MLFELKTSSVVKKQHIKIVLKSGSHFVSGNDVDMSYLRTASFPCVARDSWELR